jgi:hypothetical protein
VDGRHTSTNLDLDGSTSSQGASQLDLDQQVQENVSCCFAVQDKTWVQGPDNAWEFYTVLADAPAMACDVTTGSTGRPDQTVDPVEVTAGGCC